MIDTPKALREHLQTAIEIEWSTIPPYLCALWSLADGPNEYVAGNVEEVAMEEMLHLTLACNLLNAIGGRPRLVPDPVTQLPQPPSSPPSPKTFSSASQMDSPGIPSPWSTITSSAPSALGRSWIAVASPPLP